MVQSVVRQIDPATGTVAWTTDLACQIFGSPTLNGTTHVLAVPLFHCNGSSVSGVALLDAQTGSVLRTIATAGPEFAQPVFADGALYLADETGVLTKYVP